MFRRGVFEEAEDVVLRVNVSPDGERNKLEVVWNGDVIRTEWDRGEPEDSSFLRDYSWVRVAIEEAYRMGRIDQMCGKIDG